MQNHANKCMYWDVTQSGPIVGFFYGVYVLLLFVLFPIVSSVHVGNLCGPPRLSCKQL